MKTNPSRISRCLFLLLFVGLFGTNVEAQVFTNRTPDKAKIQPEKKPQPEKKAQPQIDDSIIMADPALFPPGTPRPKVPEFIPTMAYYVHLSRVSQVAVTDALGRTDDLFRAGTMQQVESATYHFLMRNSLQIVVPADETFTITFETNDPVMILEIVKGRGNVSPEEAVRHNDLVIDKGRARFELGPAGVSPLRLDANRDGRFETVVEPTAHVRGLAAKDTRGPEFKFEVLDRDATSILISIKAVDTGTGVKNLFYTIDDKWLFPYEGPVRVKLSESTYIIGISDDNAGNRSSDKYEFGKRPIN